jgi:outer membrane protein TolC
MRMLGVGQSFPYPGKLGLRRRAAERELDAARAESEVVRLDVIRDVKQAYYDIAYAERALEIIERNRLVLLDVIKAAEVRYAVGNGGQPDVLRARVEAARLGEEAVALLEERRAALATLNVLLDLPTDTPFENASVPVRIARAAIADSAAKIRFESASLGSRAADSPLPPLLELQDRAVARSPMLRAHESMISAQSARVELARKDHLPDFDVSIQYGQRPGRPDMISTIVSLPIPLQRGSKQKQAVREATAEADALSAEHHALRNEIRGEVARLYAELERDRAQLALYVKAIIPQGRATLESTVANYQVARTDFLSLLDAQTTLFNYETAYFRTLTSFARTLAELEKVVGEEILR